MEASHMLICGVCWRLIMKPEKSVGRRVGLDPSTVAEKLPLAANHHEI